MLPFSLLYPRGGGGDRGRKYATPHCHTVSVHREEKVPLSPRCREEYSKDVSWLIVLRGCWLFLHQQCEILLAVLAYLSVPTNLDACC